MVLDDPSDSVIWSPKELQPIGWEMLRYVYVCVCISYT